MRILGYQKTTLLDYPHKLASTIFLGGCNFRCPFCHNAQIVRQDHDVQEIPLASIMSHLIKRTGQLEGVCITGGEPTLNQDLPELVREIKDLGYLVKLDTNGTNPDMVEHLVMDHQIDYISMDIKNCPDKYALTSGRPVPMEYIKETVQFLKQNIIPYEFRTTVVKELHQIEDFIQIGKWLNGSSQYYLQNFIASDHLIQPGKFTSYDKAALQSFVELLKPYVSNTSLRGID